MLGTTTAVAIAGSTKVRQEPASTAKPGVGECRGRFAIGHRRRSRGHGRARPPASPLFRWRANLRVQAIPRGPLSRFLNDVVLGRAPGAGHRRRGDRNQAADRDRGSAQLHRQRTDHERRQIWRKGRITVRLEAVFRKAATRCRSPTMARSCRKDSTQPPQRTGNEDYSVFCRTIGGELRIGRGDEQPRCAIYGAVLNGRSSAMMRNPSMRLDRRAERNTQ